MRGVQLPIYGRDETHNGLGGGVPSCRSSAKCLYMSALLLAHRHVVRAISLHLGTSSVANVSRFCSFLGVVRKRVCDLVSDEVGLLVSYGIYTGS
jgi:hypothetical protein